MHSWGWSVYLSLQSVANLSHRSHRCREEKKLQQQLELFAKLEALPRNKAEGEGVCEQVRRRL